MSSNESHEGLSLGNNYVDLFERLLKAGPDGIRAFVPLDPNCTKKGGPKTPLIKSKFPDDWSKNSNLMDKEEAFAHLKKNPNIPLGICSRKYGFGVIDFDFDGDDCRVFQTFHSESIRSNVSRVVDSSSGGQRHHIYVPVKPSQMDQYSANSKLKGLDGDPHNLGEWHCKSGYVVISKSAIRGFVEFIEQTGGLPLAEADHGPNLELLFTPPTQELLNLLDEHQESLKAAEQARDDEIAEDRISSLDSGNSSITRDQMEEMFGPVITPEEYTESDEDEIKVYDGEKIAVFTEIEVSKDTALSPQIKVLFGEAEVTKPIDDGLKPVVPLVPKFNFKVGTRHTKMIGILIEAYRHNQSRFDEISDECRKTFQKMGLPLSEIESSIEWVREVKPRDWNSLFAMSTRQLVRHFLAENNISLKYIASSEDMYFDGKLLKVQNLVGLYFDSVEFYKKHPLKGKTGKPSCPMGSLKDFERGVLAVRTECLYNPFLDYVTSVPEHVEITSDEAALECLETWLHDDLMIEEVQNSPIGRFISFRLPMVALARQLGYVISIRDNPVLIGPGNIGKSTVGPILLPYKHGDFYLRKMCASSEADIWHHKDRLVDKLPGKVIVEIGEMTGIKNAEAGWLKDHMSSHGFHVRQVYRHDPIFIPLTHVYYGTANDPRCLPNEVNAAQRFVPNVYKRGVWIDGGRKLQKRGDEIRDKVWCSARRLMKSHGKTMYQVETMLSMPKPLKEINAENVEKHRYSHTVIWGEKVYEWIMGIPQGQTDTRSYAEFREPTKMVNNRPTWSRAAICAGVRGIDKLSSNAMSEAFAHAGLERSSSRGGSKGNDRLWKLTTETYEKMLSEIAAYNEVRGLSRRNGFLS